MLLCAAACSLLTAASRAGGRAGGQARGGAGRAGQLLHKGATCAAALFWLAGAEGAAWREGWHTPRGNKTVAGSLVRAALHSARAFHNAKMHVLQ